MVYSRWLGPRPVQRPGTNGLCASFHVTPELGQRPRPIPISPPVLLSVDTP